MLLGLTTVSHTASKGQSQALKLLISKQKRRKER
jgi:hypothetical protein